ncbi:NAD-dependent epimerase/dehydratase family protein [Dellaglioa algida]|uniref:NAD-dependent epimerase/dehydratase family protein n=1 Tax=Dellaglioa algida TaxID=105612 RepID=UPI0024C4CE2C|nr:NAD-dependent epimerase/dehydratase family protein [Dellaglioa algida]MDK1724763.1 NAD-dependent epimerase/dehydratase family protein [Dellaglioa algida]MDK1738697.1 NAD-dependent epimerase/dehydratase family protein [Dellaglioa algida]
MKRVLITGKNSYIGRSVMDQSESNGMMVDGISVRDDDWKSIDFGKYDVILHVAAIVHKKQSANTLKLYQKINRDLPFEIARKAKAEGVKQFIFMSSIAVFGKKGAIDRVEVIDNITKVSPNTYYGQSKAEAEMYLQSLSDATFTVTIIRPPMVYGKDSPGNYGLLAKLALKLPALPNIKNQRSMIYIGNLVEFIYQIIKNPMSGAFSPQNAELVDTNQMIKMIRKVHGKKTFILPFGMFIVRQVSQFTSLITKFYGSLIVVDEATRLVNYTTVTFDDSIRISEEK